MENRIYTKRISTLLSAVAVLMMIWHHLFNFKSWLPSDLGWHYWFGDFGKWATENLAQYGRMCIVIFAFMSGYALWIRKDTYSTISRRLSRLGQFLLGYWIVCILFLILGYICGDKLPEPSDICLNFIGLLNGPLQRVNVPFAWYVMYYIEFIILSPLLIRLFQKGNIWKDLVILCSIIIVFEGIYFVIVKRPIFDTNQIIGEITGALYPIIATTFGILIAKYSVIDRLHNTFLAKTPAVVCILLLVLLILFDNNIENILPAVILAPTKIIFWSINGVVFSIIMIEILSRIKKKPVEKTLTIIGQVAMYLWFVHGIIFVVDKPYLISFVYSPAEPVLIYALSLLMFTPVCYFIKYIYSKALSLGKSKRKKKV